MRLEVKRRFIGFVQVGSKQLGVGQGRNNMIHTILLLLHHVKTAWAGMLGMVILGSTFSGFSISDSSLLEKGEHV